VADVRFRRKHCCFSFRMVCDGEQLFGHSRKEVVDMVVKLGAEPELYLESRLDPKRWNEDYQEALNQAIKNGRETAIQIAKAGGVELWKLVAIAPSSSPVGYGSALKYLTLTATGAQNNQPAYLLTATVILRFTIF
jgi:uncharacterized protein YggE